MAQGLLCICLKINLNGVLGGDEMKIIIAHNGFVLKYWIGSLGKTTKVFEDSDDLITFLRDLLYNMRDDMDELK